MNDRKDRRETLGLTQAEAASRAGVSFATWRRWEEDPSRVRNSTRISCEKVLDRESTSNREAAAEVTQFVDAWRDRPILTPRQAYAIAGALNLWVDLYLREWLRNPHEEPLHELPPFDQLDLRVMMLVDENRAWTAKAIERCIAVADELKAGILPFDRPGCYFDELLMALALPHAQVAMSDEPELFDLIPARVTDGDEWALDEDWDLVSDTFDDMCLWDEWEVPLYRSHPLLPAILAERHPFTWFNDVPPSGAGYLNRLLRIETLTEDPEGE